MIFIGGEVGQIIWIECANLPTVRNETKVTLTILASSVSSKLAPSILYIAIAVPNCSS